MNRSAYKEDAIIYSGLNAQLFAGINIADLVKLRCREELSLTLAKSYLEYISKNEFSFAYSPEVPVQSSRAIVLFPCWKSIVLITDQAKCAFLIGKDWSEYNISSIVPSEITLKHVSLPEELHISYSILSIARQLVLNKPNTSQFENLALEACSEFNLQETIQDIEKFIYGNSIKSSAEIEGYLSRYNEIIDQDSLNYSSSEEISAVSSLLTTTNRMTQWIGNKMKESLSNLSSVTNFDAHKNESLGNPFDLASNVEDKSSFNHPPFTADENIETSFVNSLLEIGSKKRTIVMQIDDKSQSCYCNACPIY